ncbi:MAG: hypothetical protein U9P36_01530 [Thermodesulfobacteriota bacterium]|nr:hypothetical protein [Thermodesulfobacteriota bacterium]
MKSPSPESLKMLETLQLAVNKALDKKRRLGQYAVVWKDGKPVMLGKEIEPQKSDHPAEN